MPLAEILRAFAVGICASVPLGPAAIFVLQKSLCYGRRCGYVTSFGVTLSDTIYSVVALLALAVVQSIISRYHAEISVAGGLVVAALGCSMTFRNPFRKMESGDKDAPVSIRFTVQAFVTAFSNIGSVFIIMTLFAFFGLDVSGIGYRVFPVVLAFAAGSTVYWYLFTRGFGSLHRTIRMSNVIWINRIAGIVVIIVGIALLGNGIFELFFRR